MEYVLALFDLVLEVLSFDFKINRKGLKKFLLYLIFFLLIFWIVSFDCEILLLVTNLYLILR